MERYDARLCALWELPVVTSIGGDPVEFARIKAIRETYRRKDDCEWRGLERVTWSAVLADRRTERSETVAALDDVEPLEPEQFRRMKEEYERRRKAPAEQDG